MNNYETPSVRAYGRIDQLTGFSGVPTREDFVYNNGGIVQGAPTSQGSIDQCVFDPKKGTPTGAVCN